MRQAALLLAALCGCDPGGSADAGSPTLAVELGTGERDFEPLAEGDVLPLSAGTQGGHHVWASFRIDADPGLVTLTVNAELLGLEDGVLEGRGRVSTITAPGGAEYSGWPAQLSLPRCAGDYPLQLEVTVVAQDGRWGSDSRVVEVRPDDVPGDGCDAAQ